MLESRRQKIKMQLMERDKARSSNIKKKSTVHKSKDSQPLQRYVCMYVNKTFVSVSSCNCNH